MFFFDHFLGFVKPVYSRANHFVKEFTFHKLKNTPKSIPTFADSKFVFFGVFLVFFVNFNMSKGQML